VAVITELPNTCSVYYLSRLSPMDDFKKVVQQGFDRQKKERDEKAHQRVCAFMASTAEKNTVENLRKAGFKISYEYWSHAHNRNVFVMIREVSKKEWKTLVAEFPERKPKLKK
jgi:hypothetical protein